MRPLLLALAVGILLSGCKSRKVHRSVSPPPPATTGNTLVPGTVIRTSGSWTYFDTGNIRHLAVTPSGKRVEWKLSFSRGSGGSGGGNSSTSASLDLTAPTDPWFIYVESPELLWFCDGTKNLSYRIWHAGGRSDSANVILHGKPGQEHQQVPTELIRLLPAEMQKLLPETTGKKRPSI